MELWKPRETTGNNFDGSGMLAKGEGIAFRLYATLIATMLVFLTSSDAASEKGSQITGYPVHSNSVFFGMGTFWQLNRCGGAGLRLSLGYDRAFKEGGWFSMGSRVGMLENGGTAAFAGLRTLFWTGTQGKSKVRFRIGAVVDVWINMSDEEIPRCILGVGGETGLQIKISDTLAVDFPIEAEVLPYFNPNAYIFQVGTQLVAFF
jgi:hypothetical protein